MRKGHGAPLHLVATPIFLGTQAIEHDGWSDQRLKNLGAGVMVACCSPSAKYTEESLNTLQYAYRAKNITNSPVIQMDSTQRLVFQLRQVSHASFSLAPSLSFAALVSLSLRTQTRTRSVLLLLSYCRGLRVSLHPMHSTTMLVPFQRRRSNLLTRLAIHQEVAQLRAENIQLRLDKGLPPPDRGLPTPTPADFKQMRPVPPRSDGDADGMG